MLIHQFLRQQQRRAAVAALTAATATAAARRRPPSSASRRALASMAAHTQEPEGKEQQGVRAGACPVVSPLKSSGMKRRSPGAVPAQQQQQQQPPTVVVHSRKGGASEPAAAAFPPSSAAAATTPQQGQSQSQIQSFYRRQLPTTHCVAFSSAEGRRLFQEALREGGMETYFPLSEQFKTQDDPAFCGLGALTMVLNALAIDPGRTWKGPWRWFDESMLECCEPLEVVRAKGICISKLDCLARCNGATTQLKYGDSAGLAEFREDVVRLTSTTPPPEELMIVGYNRKVMGQTGTGHFSPVGGYHKGRDMALIMDVARFKYPPHWVPVPLLWEAMQTVDPETGRSRGYLIVAKGFVSESLLFTIDKKRHQEFAQLAHWLQDAADTLPPLMADAVLRHGSGPDGGVDHVRLLPVFLETLPASVASMVVAFHNTLCVHYTEGHLRSIDHLLEAIEAHPIYTQLATGGDSREAQLLGRFRARWEEHGHGLGCCDRSRAVSEKHVLTIFYISLLEWICLREGWPISRLFPHAVYSPPLQLEVGQLKRKFAAMAQAEEEAAAAAAGTCSIPAAGRSWSGVSTKQ